METKTVREWFEQTLPKAIAKKAINNAINYYDKVLNVEAESFNDALASSFFWLQSPEGHEYWSKICDKYEN